MGKLKSSISSILIIVAFLVLTALTATWYNGDEEQKTKLDQNAIYQKIQWGINAILFSSQKLADINLKRNVGVGQKIKEELESMDLDKEYFKTPDIGINSWSDFTSYFKKEWQKEKKEKENNDDEGLLTWEKNEADGNIIITFKNGQQYKLPLLSKWFKK